MKKAIITGLAGILLTSLALNGQLQDKKYTQNKDKGLYEEWQGNTEKTPYMKYKEEQERQEQQKQKTTLEKKTDEQINQNSAVYHTIQKGDTFYNLADKYWGTNKEADEIEKLNPGINPDKLKIGQKIRVK